jgi:hypothetical protein
MPSLYDSFIRYSMPVYPGAIQAKPPVPPSGEMQKLHEARLLTNKLKHIPQRASIAASPLADARGSV